MKYAPYSHWRKSVQYKSIRLPIALILIFFLASAFPAQANEVKEWTFMIFMAADNNLEGATSLDINELEQFGSTDKVNFVAQIDRNGNYSQNSELKWSGARRFYIVKDNKPKKMTSPHLQDLGNVDMADPAALKDFVNWAKTSYPAKKYALILWNHGTGWKEIQPSVMEADTRSVGIPANLQNIFDNISYNISYDDTSKSSMNIPTLGKTLEGITRTLGQPLDVLGFDACLMQMAEVAWEVKSHARFMVGSPDLEPDRGWPYDLIARELTKNPTMDAKKLAELIPVAYNKSYLGGSQGNTAVVLSSIDLAKSAKFGEKLDAFCKTAIKNIHDIDKYETARNNALKYSYGDYIDLAHFLTLLTGYNISSETKTAARSLLTAINGTKKYPGYVNKLARNGEKFAESRGLSIFFPTRQGFRTYKNRYKLHEFCSQTLWFSFLEETSTPSIPYLKIEDIILEDKNKDGRIAAGEEVTVLLSIKNLGKKALKSADITCVTDSKFLNAKTFQANLTKLPAPGKSSLIKAFSFTVSPETPVHQDVSINITLSSNNIPESTIKTTFYIKEPFASTGHALLVLTDNFSPASPVLQQMMNSAKIKYDTWDRMLDGDLKPEVLKRYLDGWVFVAVQDSTPEQSLTEYEVDAIDKFLKSGGRLVLNGQDIAFSLRDSNFLRQRCKVKFVQDDVNVHVVMGDNNFAGGKSFQIFGGDGANNQKWPDEVDPLPGARAIIKYNEGARDMADDREMIGPNHKAGSYSKGIKSSGVAGVKVEDGYRLMLFTFGIEAVNNSSQRTAFMKEIAAFMQPDPTAEIRNLARAAARRPRQGTSEQEVIDRADLLSNVETRLMRQIKDTLDDNPQSQQQILNEIQLLPKIERDAMRNLEKNVQSLLEFNQSHGTLRQR